MKLTSLLLSICIGVFCFSVNAQKNQKVIVKHDASTPEKTKSPQFTTSERPQNKTSKQTKAIGVKGNEIIGEGEYLTFTKQIMGRSVTGNIPDGFPKHIKGQSRDQYVAVMKQWAKNNPSMVVGISGEGEYLGFDSKIKQALIAGAIPQGFPKHVKGQSKQQYVQIMKSWAKNNSSSIKQEYKNQAFK